MATILVDTRQQANKHNRKHEDLERMGHTLVRSKLYVGDYALLQDVTVDTKRSIAELAQDVWQDHDRFMREVKAAQDAGIHLVVLVENTHGVSDIDCLFKWMEPRHELARRHGKRPIHGATLAKACLTISKHYGCEFRFCKPSETAAIINEILLGGEDNGNGTRHIADHGGDGCSDIPNQAEGQEACD